MEIHVFKLEIGDIYAMKAVLILLNYIIYSTIRMD